jgi:hypothetical protein
LLVRGNPQERELRPYDELVADTLTAVLRDVVNAPVVPGERTCRIPFSVYAGEQDGIVTRASAQALFPRAAALPGDHFTIVRPTSQQHRSYTTVKRLLLEAASASERDPPMETVGTLAPAALEVHTAVPAGQAAGPGAELTAYLPREHDIALRAELSTVFAGGASRLVMLTGESSTGKTRALYQALQETAPDNLLLHPVDTESLLGLLGAGRIGPGCVLWLR